MKPLVPDSAAFENLSKLPGGKFRVQDAERLRQDMANPEKAYEVEGVRHWRSNDAVIPSHVYRDAALVCPATQERAYQAHLDQFLRGQRKNARPLSAEARAEARAAMGPNVEMVNVVTGQRFRT